MRMFLLRVHPALELKVKGDGWVRTLRGRGGVQSLIWSDFWVVTDRVRYTPPIDTAGNIY